MADRDDEKTYTVMDWLGLRDAPRWGLARPLGILISVAMMLLWALALAAAVSVLKGSFSEGNTGLGAGGLIVALLGAPFLIWSTVIKHNTLSVSRQTLALSETALFNDKVDAALQGLYSRRQITRVIKAGDEEKVLTEWEDDIVQRNGAIDRLEGLANERPSEVPRIANMLSVYVRELSRGTAQSHPRQDYAELVDPISGMMGISKGAALAQLGVTEGDVSIESLGNWANALKPFRTDVEKAAQTLGRLLEISGADRDAITIDLRGANLQGFDLNGLCFAKAKLQGARLEGASLSEARMEGANLFGARMEGANLFDAQMRGADLGWAWIEGAILSKAWMEGATLTAARMEGANLAVAWMEGANLRLAWMKQANLFGARMEGAYLSEARMEGANLFGARMEGANLSEARMDSRTVLTAAGVSLAAVSTVDYSDVSISLDQVKSMFGDASVTLPNGITPTHPDWPKHWPKFDLGGDFWDEWEKWKADPAAYVPPVKPDTDD